MAIFLIVGDEKEIIYHFQNLKNFKKVNKMKSKEKVSNIFISSVTHNFRTPINIIEGNVEAILFNESLDESTKQYCLNIQNSAKNIMFILQDLLDYSLIKLDTFQPRYEPFNLEKTCNEIISRLNDRFIDKNLEGYSILTGF